MLLLLFLDGLVVPWDAVLLEDLFGLVALELSNFNFAVPVLVALLKFHVTVALVDKHDRVRHILFALANHFLLLFYLVV